MEEQPLQGSWVAEAGGEAPPPFVVDANLAVPCEVSGLDLLFEADAEHGRGTGRGRLRFTLPQSGRPLFDLVPRPLRLVVDGQQLPPARLRVVKPPDDPTFLRMLDEQLDAGEHTIEVEYPLGNSTAQFVDGGVRLGLFMTDPIFNRYVYGKAEDGEDPHEAADLLGDAAEAVAEALAPPPPPAFTPEQLRALL